MLPWETVKRAIELRLETMNELWDDEVHLLKSETGVEGPYAGLMQQCPYYAVDLLLVDQHPDRVEKLIEKLTSLQFRDPEHRGYGRWPRNYGEENLRDPNSGFFVNLGLMAIYFYLRDRISDDSVKAIEETFPHSLVTFSKPAQGVSYTNAQLGDFCCGAILAEMLSDARAFATVHDNFQLFYEKNFEFGIPERLTACYYGVDVSATSLLLGVLKDKRIRWVCSRLLPVLLQELSFFESRQPLPARRSYNSARHHARKFTWLDWLIGNLPLAADETQTAKSDQSWSEQHYALTEHSGTAWYGLTHLLMTRAGVDYSPPKLPTPRIMQGKIFEEISYYSLFHQDYTLGCFTRYPFPTATQNLNDFPVGFSGPGANLGSIGVYSLDADGVYGFHPGTEGDEEPLARFFSEPRGMPGRLYYICHQDRDIQIVLFDIDQLNNKFQEIATLIRLPQFAGKLHFDEQGPITDESGEVEHGWIFLDCAPAYFGLYPLKRLNVPKWAVEYGPTRWTLKDGKLRLFLDNDIGETPALLQLDNLSNGVLMVAGGASDYADFAQFRDYCRAMEISDEIDYDRYIVRNDRPEGIRAVAVDDGNRTLRLEYDYQTNTVLERSVNGVKVAMPNTLSAIQFV